MAKGAKKQQLQSQTTTQAAPPSYAQPYVNDILSRAQNASYQPYQPYGGNRIAGFTDAEKTARTGIMDLKAPTQFNTATEMATKAGNYTPGTFDGGYDQAKFTGGDYATGQFNTDSFTDSGMASKYMSPYMQNVVDVQKRKAREDAQQTQLAGNLGASRLGTTGGSRQLLATLNRERNLATQMGDLQAKGSQDAYTAAMDQYKSEADRRMDAQKQIENSRQYASTQRSRAEEAAAAERNFAAKYKMDAAKFGEDSRQFSANNALSAASQLNQIGTSQQDSNLKRLSAMSEVGETERRLRQTGLDTAYDDFRNQRDYEKNQLRDYSDIVGAQPEGNRTESVYGQPANQTGALIGAAGNIGSAYMMSKYGNSPGYNVGAPVAQNMLQNYGPRQSPKEDDSNITLPRQYKTAAGGEIYSYNSGGLVALADGGGVDAGKQQGLAAIAGGNDGSKYKLRNDPKELLYSTMGDPAKLQALTQQGIDPTAVGIAAMLAKRIYDTQSMAMSPQQTTVAGLLNPMPPQPQGQPQQPQGQMQGQPQGQPQDQQGLAGIAPQGQPMGDPMQPPMGDPSMGNPMQPPMDPMQAQGLEALTQQDQPMEEQPMEEPMMAANGGLMNINRPDDYYDEESYSHCGIAHFAAGEQALLDLERMRDKRPERQKTYQALGLDKPFEIASRTSSNIDEKKRLLDSLPESVRRKLSLLTLPQIRGFLEKTTDQEFLPNVQEQPIMPRRDASIGSDKPLNIKGLGETADAYLKPAPNVTGRSMMMPGKTAGTAEMPALPPSRNFRQEMADILNEKPAAATPATGYVPSEGSKKLSDLIDRYSKPSEIKEAYLASLNEQQPLKDTSKQDFWRTIGEMSSKLTEGSLEGKGLLEAAAGATSVLPGSVARSIENKQAREDAAKADRLTKLATMYGIDTSDRAAMMDLAMQQYEITSQEAADLYNRQQEEEAKSYARDRDYKQDRIEALKLQMPEGGGEEFTEIKRAYYNDLRSTGMPMKEAAEETNRVFGQNGAGGNPFASPSELESAKGNAMFAVITANPTISFEDPRFMPLVEKEMARVMALSGKGVNFPKVDRSYNSQGEPE